MKEQLYEHLSYIVIFIGSATAIVVAFATARKKQGSKNIQWIVGIFSFLVFAGSVLLKEKEIEDKNDDATIQRMRYDSIISSQDAAYAHLKAAKKFDSLHHELVLSNFDTSKSNQRVSLLRLANSIDLQNESLKQITGGDTYSYVMLTRNFRRDPSMTRTQHYFDFNLINEGDYPLHETYVIFERIPTNTSRFSRDTSIHVPFLHYNVQRKLPGDPKIKFSFGKYLQSRLLFDEEQVICYNIRISQRNDMILQKVVILHQPDPPYGVNIYYATEAYSVLRRKVIYSFIERDFPLEDGRVNWKKYGRGYYMEKP